MNYGNSATFHRISICKVAGVCAMFACAIAQGAQRPIHMKGRGQDFDRSQLWTSTDVENYLAIPHDLDARDNANAVSIAALESYAIDLAAKGFFGKDVKGVLLTFRKKGDHSFSFNVAGTPDLLVSVFDWSEWNAQKADILKCAMTSTADWRDIPNDFKPISFTNYFKIRKTQAFQQQWALKTYSMLATSAADGDFRQLALYQLGILKRGT